MRFAGCCRLPARRNRRRKRGRIVRAGCGRTGVEDLGLGVAADRLSRAKPLGKRSRRPTSQSSIVRLERGPLSQSLSRNTINTTENSSFVVVVVVVIFAVLLNINIVVFRADVFSPANCVWIIFRFFFLHRRSEFLGYMSFAVKNVIKKVSTQTTNY